MRTQPLLDVMLLWIIVNDVTALASAGFQCHAARDLGQGALSIESWWQALRGVGRRMRQEQSVAWMNESVDAAEGELVPRCDSSVIIARGSLQELEVTVACCK